MIRKLLGFLLSIIVAVVLFFILITVVPMNTKTLEKMELTYIFIDDDGSEYNIFDKSHGAAKDWSFLFRPKTGDNNNSISNGDITNQTGSDTIDNEIFSGDISELLTGEDNILSGDVSEQLTGEDEIFSGDTLEQDIGEQFTGESVDEPVNTGENIGDKSNDNNKGDKGNVLGTKDYIGNNTGSDFTGDETDLTGTQNLIGDKELPDNGDFNLPEGAIEKPQPKDCQTPWGIMIRHNESVLAYQQRSDVPDICNVQRRTCVDGVLDGSFVQPACDETVTYVYSNRVNNLQKEDSSVVVYTKKEVVPTNPETPNELVQNPKYAKNDAAEFDKNGKIKGDTKPITDWDENGNEWEYADHDYVEQVNVDYYNCRSPRGELVQHGQFVKAYAFPYGFTNSNCKTELRLCVDGELKGSYKYKDCEYLEMTYEEYYNQGETEDEFVGGEHQITNEEKKGFWNRLKNLFK